VVYTFPEGGQRAHEIGRSIILSYVFSVQQQIGSDTSLCDDEDYQAGS